MVIGMNTSVKEKGQQAQNGFLVLNTPSQNQDLILISVRLSTLSGMES